jgi:hypothetical protein
MIVAVSVGEVRPGYELWRPNREKTEAQTTKVVCALLLWITAALTILVAITGFSLMSGGAGMGIMALIYGLLYAFFGFLVIRWNRGILPVAAALSIILAILCAVGANSWFARDKAGFSDGLIPSPLIGLLVIIIVLVQIVLISVAIFAFNQEWHVEEERLIGSSEDYGAGAPPENGAPQPA